MSKIHEQLRVLNDERATEALVELHRLTERQTLKLVARFLPQLPRLLFRRQLPWQRLGSRLDDLTLAMDPKNGVLCYMLARSLCARHVVEYGSSFGISTIYLALAVRDNGGGVVVATEFVPEKAARLRENIARAGLQHFVDVREGDARETLRHLDGAVDLLINDGFPAAMLPVTKLVAPKMRRGAIALCGNVELFPADHADYVAWMRAPENGFRSTRWPMSLTGEFSVKVSEEALS
jgi:predicted O-methyltransferase YrrM